jgi:hypothetical protein
MNDRGPRLVGSAFSCAECLSGLCLEKIAEIVKKDPRLGPSGRRTLPFCLSAFLPFCLSAFLKTLANRETKSDGMCVARKEVQRNAEMKRMNQNSIETVFTSMERAKNHWAMRTDLWPQLARKSLDEFAI